MISVCTLGYEEEPCNASTTASVMPLWSLTCDKLQNYPEKHLYLRDYFTPHFVGSSATFECSAGYGFETGVKEIYKFTTITVQN